MNDDCAPLLAGHHHRPLLAAIGGHAAAAGFRTAAVGGVVRDLLLGILSRDIDIAVAGDAIACARHLAGALGGTVAKTSRFGTAVLMLGDTRVDLAMARTESYPKPGALPDVAPGTLADDLARRDFTVNAMALEISPACFGRLLDPLGGRADLAARLIRVLHPASFRDDPTRMLRAVRLAHRLGFAFAAPTAELLGEAVRGRYWLTVGSRRLGQEIRLSLQEDDLPGLCRRLDACGLFRSLFAAGPDDALLAALARIAAAGEWLGRFGLVPDPVATAALLIGGRAEGWLCPQDGARGWPARLPALRRLLASPGRAGLEVAPGDIPPAVLAYLWIMCQNEKEQQKLETLLEETTKRAGCRQGRANPEPAPAAPDKEDN